MKNHNGFTLLEVTIALAILLVVSTGLIAGTRQRDSRRLEHATTMLHADIIYAQRRAINEGVRIGILFGERYTYQLISRSAPGHPAWFYTIGEPIPFASGAWFHNSTGGNEIIFLPRGTVNQATTIQLRIGPGSGNYQQNTTITVSGGRVYAEDPPFRLQNRFNNVLS